MKKFLIGIVSILALACNSGPQPLQFGQDACAMCKMTLMDPVFGAELVTSKGKAFKFDDVKCMLLYRHEHAGEKFSHELVVDYMNPGTLINADTAFFLKSELLQTPMSGGIVACASMEGMKKLKEKYKGIYLTWGEAQTEFK